MGSDSTVGRSIVFFDGVCNLCNSSVIFIIKRDKKSRFMFAPLQSGYAKEHLVDEYVKGSLATMVVLIDGQVFTQSNGALEIARRLSGFWPVLYVFKMIPRFLRDAVYKFIASNRYRFFGRKDQCMVPSPSLKIRFID